MYKNISPEVFEIVYCRLAFIYGMRLFVRNLAMIIRPDAPPRNLSLKSDRALRVSLLEAIEMLGRNSTVTERTEVMNVIVCNEMNRLCAILHEACAEAGLEHEADMYLGYSQFRRLALEANEYKVKIFVSLTSRLYRDDIKTLLARVSETISNDRFEIKELGEETRDRYLSNMSCILNQLGANVCDGRPNILSWDMKSLTALVAEVRRGQEAIVMQLQAGKDEIVDKIEKSAVKKRRRRRNEYSDKAIALVQLAWKTLARSGASNNTSTVRFTYADAYENMKRRDQEALKEAGINSVKDFAKAMHASNSRKSRERTKRTNLAAAEYSKSIAKKTDSGYR